MKTMLGKAIILVNDYDEAFEFYEANFLCKKLFDTSTTDGQRFVHISFSEGDGIGIWFMKVNDDEKDKPGTQTAGRPTLVIYTDDVKGLYQRVKSNGVEIQGQLVQTADSTFFNCLDLYGNRLTVVQITAG
jgi:predicted enzyme related to lactoylglutathione lyase